MLVWQDARLEEPAIVVPEQVEGMGWEPVAHVARQHGGPGEDVALGDGDGVEEEAGAADQAGAGEGGDEGGVGGGVLAGHLVEQVEGWVEAAGAEEGGEHGVVGDLVSVRHLVEQVEGASEVAEAGEFGDLLGLEEGDGEGRMALEWRELVEFGCLHWNFFFFFW